MAQRVAPAPDARVPLSRERVLRAALAIADRDGIDSLTMRRLAQELGVEAMSLYYYLPNKDAILAGLVDLVASEIELPSRGRDWKASVRKTAISYHEALGRHAWATALVRKAFGIPQLRLMDSLLRCLREAGFSADVTYHAYHALDSHILGSTMWEAGFTEIKDLAERAQSFLRQINPEEYPFFVEHAQQHFNNTVRGKSTFEFGLDLILDSLEKIRRGQGRSKRRGPG